MVCDAVLEPIVADCHWFLSNFSLDSVMFLHRELSLGAHNLVKLGHLYGSKT